METFLTQDPKGRDFSIAVMDTYQDWYQETGNDGEVEEQ